MKKLGIVTGAFIALLLALVLIAPRFIDVDKYRPQIVNAANKKIQGTLEIGKLSLSLWGQIRIEAAGVTLRDAQGREVIVVKDAYFHVPLLPLFSGSPLFTLKMNQPQVNIIKDRSGKFNVATLFKTPSQPQQGTQLPPSSQTPPSQEAQRAPALPAFVTRARLGVELDQAQINYRDETSGLTSQVKDLNLRLKDISLDRPTSLELWADLNTSLGKTLLLTGPARLDGKLQPIVKNNKIDQINLTAQLDMDSVRISSSGIFEKKPGIPSHAELAMTASDQEARIENFSARFFNAEIKAQGSITHINSTTGQPIVNVSIQSNEIELKPWVDLIPMLKQYELGGSAHFDAAVQGPSQKLGYQGKLTVTGLTAQAPTLKTRPRIDGVIQLNTDQIDPFLFTLKAPGNDLKIQGKLVSFTKPRLNLQVNSDGMDLDQLINFPPRTGQTAMTPETQVASETKTNESPGKMTPQKGTTTGKLPSQAGNSPNYDATLDPLRENPLWANLVGTITVNMKMLKANNIKMTNLLCDLSIRDLVAGMDRCSLNIFGGIVKADSHVQMKPKIPTYQFNIQVGGLDMGQAIASQMALFKNTFTGKAQFHMNGQSASFNPDPAIAQLKANGSMKIEKAEFTTIDVAKMVTDALNKAIAQIGEKIPAAQGKRIQSLPSHGSQYEFISSHFSIANGKFSAPDFYAKAEPHQGVDLKGTATVGLKDQSLNTHWEVIDTYNLTRLRDISMDQNGIHVDHIFANGNSPVQFPIHAGCTLKAPCYSYTEVPLTLGEVALKNIGHALEGRTRETLRKEAESAIKKNLTPEQQEKLKDAFKGLFN